MKTFIFGFGWEIMGTFLYALAWGWLCDLLEKKVPWFKSNVFIIAGVAALMLHPFVVNYIVISFWIVITMIGMLLWGMTIGNWLEDKAPWINGLNGHALRVFILIAAFIILRNIMFHGHPEKMWYSI